jgi:hypothetical protein
MSMSIFSLLKFILSPVGVGLDPVNEVGDLGVDSRFSLKSTSISPRDNATEYLTSADCTADQIATGVTLGQNSPHPGMLSLHVSIIYLAPVMIFMPTILVNNKCVLIELIRQHTQRLNGKGWHELWLDFGNDLVNYIYHDLWHTFCHY